MKHIGSRNNADSICKGQSAGASRIWTDGQGYLVIWRIGSALRILSVHFSVTARFGVSGSAAKYRPAS